MLDFIKKQTAEIPDASIIWMHGLGADGNDFADIIPELGLSQNIAIRFIFPHANMIPVSINNGFKMRAWYDISNSDLGANADIDGIEKNSKFVEELIDAEIASGINSERIILIGFSQGGVMALHTALRYNKKLAGAASLSSYYPTVENLNTINSKIPVFFGHGKYDPVVPIGLGQKAFDFLKENGNQVEMNVYNMQHTVCIEELKSLGRWIERILKES